MNSSQIRHEPPRTEQRERKTSTLYLLRHLTGTYLKPYAFRIVIAVILMAISAAMTAAFAKLLEPVMDLVLVGKRPELIVPMGLAVFSVFLINGASSYGHSVMMNMVGQSIVADIQRDLFSRFMGLDLAFFNKNPSGQLVARMVHDTTVMRAAVTDSITGIGKSFLTLFFLIVLMFMQDAKLALSVFTIFPIVALFVARLGKRLRKVSKRIQEKIASMLDVFTQIFQGVREVKVYGMEDYERERAGDMIDSVRNMFFRNIKIGNLSAPVNEGMIGLALCGVIIYGGRQVIAGHLTVGELMSFIAAFSLAYEPLKRLAKLNNNLQRGLGAAERVLEMMGLEPSITEKPGAVIMADTNPEIIFEDVSFGYEEGEGAALENVSFEAKSGTVTALVGPSGSGKTTALNLVARLYDASSGRILIGSTDIRDLSIKSLRAHMAFVSQNIMIFDDTVRANIAYGNMAADDDAIIKAAKAAAADEFIRELPQGYDTRLGEMGARLSGGQRQRIAIARAMLRDAPILLLDEATSALDNESERAIQSSLEKLQAGRTTLVIAHRLTTVKDADQILVLDKGRIVETGKHDKLLKQKGLYARMYESGFSG